MGKKSKNTMPQFVTDLLKKFGINNPKNKHLVNIVLAIAIGSGGVAAFLNYRYFLTTSLFNQILEERSSKLLERNWEKKT